MSRQIWTIFWCRNDSNYLDVKLSVFKRGDDRDFHLNRNLTTGDADFNQFMGLRRQLALAAANFGRGEVLSPVLISTMSKDIDEQLELARKVIDVVDRAKIKLCLTLKRYNVEWPESSYARIRIFGEKKENEKFEQNGYVNYELDEFIYLLDVMNSVCDKILTNQPSCNFLKKYLQLITL